MLPVTEELEELEELRFVVLDFQIDYAEFPEISNHFDLHYYYLHVIAVAVVSILEVLSAIFLFLYFALQAHDSIPL